MSAQRLEDPADHWAAHPSCAPVAATPATASPAAPVAEDLRDLSGAVARLDRAELAAVPGDWFVYSCPWCPLDVVDANTLAVQIMERHLDRHVAAGDHDRPALRIVA
jgi:hypothetical protein